MGLRRTERLSSLDIVEGFHIAHALSALDAAGVLAALNGGRTVPSTARACGLDATLLGTVLEYLAARTDIVRNKGARRFATGPGYSPGTRFLLDLYAGAYRSTAQRLARLLREPSEARRSVDRGAYARAFLRAQRAAAGALPVLVRRLRLDHVLDLGCGPAPWLISFARAQASFVGWGLELERRSCRAARAAARAAGVHGRVHILQGDGSELEAAVPPRVLARVKAVTASQFANELFSEGTPAFVSWLRRLRTVLPGRICVLADYYGRLGRHARSAGRRETLLHDYAQAISGQGVPPGTLKEWRALYRRAGCRLVHVFEDRTTSLFVHLLVL